MSHLRGMNWLDEMWANKLVAALLPPLDGIDFEKNPPHLSPVKNQIVSQIEKPKKAIICESVVVCSALKWGHVDANGECISKVDTVSKP